jgi:uncharacterized protein (TIGR02996 family)
MNPETILHAAIVRDPGDDLAWLALADWLEESGQEQRGELLRITRTLLTIRQDERRPALEARQRELLAAGVVPCLPERAIKCGMRFVLIPPGASLLGDEARSWVTFDRPFWLAKYPVTQGEFKAITGAYPRGSRRGKDRDHLPVEAVTASAMEQVTRRLSTADGSCRLPWEWEWEYACRAGTTTAYHGGERLTYPQACYGEMRAARTRSVGSYPPNAFGLHDMHGNVWEVCLWEWGKNDPGLALKGGAWNSPASVCRAGNRIEYQTTDLAANSDTGFRVLMEWAGV